MAGPLRSLSRKIAGLLSGRSPEGAVTRAGGPSDGGRAGGLVQVNCGGHRIWVDSADKGIAPRLLSGRGYEPHEVKLFRRFIRRGMVVVDIGANIGVHTLLAARLVGRHGRVYAFEPEPHNYELLERNIESNGYSNVIAVQKAVAGEDGTTRLFVDKANRGAHSLAEGNLPDKEGCLDIETTTLDGFLQSHAGSCKVDFIKIDAQGAEGMVLRGAGQVMAQSDLRIVMEFWPSGLRNMGTDPLALLRQLVDLGFAITTIGRKCDKVVAADLPRLVEACDSNSKGFINLLLEK